MIEYSRVSGVPKAEMTGSRWYWYSDDLCKILTENDEVIRAISHQRSTLQPAAVLVSCSELMHVLMWRLDGPTIVRGPR